MNKDFRLLIVTWILFYSMAFVHVAAGDKAKMEKLNGCDMQGSQLKVEPRVKKQRGLFSAASIVF